MHYKQIDHAGLRFKHKILSCVYSIEKKNYEIKVIKTKNENHVDISSSLSKLSEVESNNNKNKLSIYCKFLSEKRESVLHWRTHANARALLE